MQSNQRSDSLSTYSGENKRFRSIRNNAHKTTIDAEQTEVLDNTMDASAPAVSEVNVKRTLPKSADGSVAMEENSEESDESSEDALAPILVNGAALTCQVAESDTLYCLFEVTDLATYSWDLYDMAGDQVEADLYEVSEMENQTNWNVVIQLLAPIGGLRVEASTIITSSEGVREKHQHSSSLMDMETSLSIQELLSIVYESSDYGDLDLNIAANNDVTGTWRDGSTVGEITGRFSVEDMSIEGRWIERPFGESEYGGEFIFRFTLSAEGEITVDGEYSNDGSQGTTPWPLTPKNP